MSSRAASSSIRQVGADRIILPSLCKLPERVARLLARLKSRLLVSLADVACWDGRRPTLNMARGQLVGDACVLEAFSEIGLAMRNVSLP